MEYVLVAIALASLLCNVALVRAYAVKAAKSGSEPTQNLPTSGFVEVWTDAAVEQIDWDFPVDEDPPPPVQPAAVPAVREGPWVNRNGIQQGVNAAPSAPLPPIKPVERPPLARPDGFVR